MEDKQHFGNYLKILLQKYRVKHFELADALDVSRQYVSSIITGRKTPSRDCFDAILTFLDEYLSSQEKQILANKLIYAKTGINNSLKKLIDINTTGSVDELILLEDFRKLSPDDKIEVIRFVRRKEIETLQKVPKILEEQAVE
jgi:transcriptional regulator with XRE-family HTH domain